MDDDELNATTLHKYIFFSSANSPSQSLIIVDKGLRRINISLAAHFPQQPLTELDICKNATLSEITQGSATFASLTALKTLELDFNALQTLDKSLFADLCSLTVLDLSHNQLKNLHQDTFRSLNSLKELYLNDNQLHGSLAPDLFAPLQQLSDLDLQRNELETLQRELLAPLTSLQILYVNANHLSRIETGSFDTCTNLVLLDLSANRLEELETPDLFTCLGKLEYLDLSYNQLQCDELDFTVLRAKSQLLEIRLYKNQPRKVVTEDKETLLSELRTILDDPEYFLNQYCDAIQNQVDLEAEKRKVNLSEAREELAIEEQVQRVLDKLNAFKQSSLDTLASTFSSELSQMKKVDFENMSDVSQIEKCSKELKQMVLNYTELEFVKSGGGLKATDDDEQENEDIEELLESLNTSGAVSFGKLRIKRQIDQLNKTTIKKFLQPYGALPTVLPSVLVLSRNNIFDIDKETFASIESRLTSITLDNNHLIKLDAQTFANLAQLLELNLSFNKIESLEPSTFRDLCSLQRLNLKYNRLRTLECGLFDNLKSLTELSLSDNKLCFVENGHFSKLTRLVTLDLGYNQIKHVYKCAFEGLESLRKLTLNFNRIKVLDQDVFAALGRLEYLILSDNLIKYVHKDAFRGAVSDSLKSLQLNHNRLSSLETQFNGFKKLNTLNLSNNKIKQLDLALLEPMLRHVVKLHLSQNRLSDEDSRAVWEFREKECGLKTGL